MADDHRPGFPPREAELTAVAKLLCRRVLFQTGWPLWLWPLGRVVNRIDLWWMTHVKPPKGA